MDNKNNIIELYICNIEENSSFFEDANISQNKKQHLVSKYLKDKYIGNYYLNDNNKPISKNLYFNISHSNSLVILATNKKYEIGVDIELIKKVDNKLKKYIQDNISDEDFLKAWVSKESLAKCIGIGIDKNFHNLPFIPYDGLKMFNNTNYYSHLIIYNDYFISITIKSSQDFQIKINKININS